MCVGEARRRSERPCINHTINQGIQNIDAFFPPSPSSALLVSCWWGWLWQSVTWGDDWSYTTMSWCVVMTRAIRPQSFRQDDLLVRSTPYAK